MKPLLLTLGSALLLVGTAHAQTTFRFGPQVGIVRSTLHSTLPNLSGRTGIEAGLLGVLQVGHFAFQPAVLYSQRGFKQEALLLGSSAGGIYTTTTRLDYLRVPLQFVYTQRATGQGFQLFVGPYLGTLLGGRNRQRGGDTQETGRVVVTNEHTIYVNTSASIPDYNYYARRLDLGAQVGLGYQLGRALLQLSYSQGMRDVRAVEYYVNGSRIYEGDNLDTRNRAFQASLSYLFGPKS